MFIKRMLSILLILVLFLGAIYSTWSNMTNLSWKDIKNSLQEEANKVQEVEAINTIEEKNYMSNVRKQQLSDNPGMINVIGDEQSFKRKKVIATGYTAGYESTGKKEDHPQYGVTFSGIPVKRDVYSTIAADVNVFPIGTILYVPNYGYGVVADIGGAIKGDKIDLYFHTVEDVYREWGKREVEVYILKEGNGTLSEAEFNQLNESDSLQVFQNEEEKAS